MATQYIPEMSHKYFDQFIAEYAKESDLIHKINSDNGIATGIDEEFKTLFKLIPNAFKESDFKIYNILNDVAESNLNINRGASAGLIDRDLKNWSKKDDAYKVKHIYKEKSKYSLGRPNGTGKSSYSMSNPVNSQMLGYYDKADLNIRKYIKNPPKCRLTSYTNSHFEQFKSVEPYVNKISRILKEQSPSHYEKHKKFLVNKDKIGNSVFTTLTINKNFQTAIHTDSGDYKEGIGVISCMGDFEGGDFCLPNYKIQIKLKPTDLLFVNVHRHHTNLPITSGNRISCVSYIREHINKCDDLVNYKIYIKDINEDLIEYLKNNGVSSSKIYITDNNNCLRFDGINVLDRDSNEFFTSFTPVLHFNKIQPIPEDKTFEEYIVDKFTDLYETETDREDWNENYFCINIPEHDSVSTLISYKTASIEKNIKSWEKLGYNVNVYSYNNLPGCLNANLICENGDLYYFAINLLRKKETIFLSEDMLLLNRIPQKEIIISSENNRSNNASPCLGILKIPMNHNFLKDISKFLNKNPNITENKRRFERGIKYFALAKHVVTPNCFCKINRIYSKSIFEDYELYKEQPSKYVLNIPLFETFKNCIGVRCYNINTIPDENSLYSKLYSSVAYES